MVDYFLRKVEKCPRNLVNSKAPQSVGVGAAACELILPLINFSTNEQIAIFASTFSRCIAIRKRNSFIWNHSLTNLEMKTRLPGVICKHLHRIERKLV